MAMYVIREEQSNKQYQFDYVDGKLYINVVGEPSKALVFDLTSISLGELTDV